MLYNIVLVSAIQQHESATGIHMSPPSGTSLPPPTPSTPPGCHRAPGLSSLHRTADSHLPSILHTVVCKANTTEIQKIMRLLQTLVCQQIGQSTRNGQIP